MSGRVVSSVQHESRSGDMGSSSDDSISMTSRDPSLSAVQLEHEPTDDDATAMNVSDDKAKSSFATVGTEESHSVSPVDSSVMVADDDTWSEQRHDLLPTQQQPMIAHMHLYNLLSYII